jgi:glycine cleavage system H protein
MASRVAWRASRAAASLLRMRSTCVESRPPFRFPFAYSRGFSSVVKNFKYTDSHEWVKVDGPLAVIGITDHAQEHLGDVVFVELPDVGTTVSKGGTVGVVESVKSTSDVFSPVSGEVAEVNSELNSSPGLVNGSPYDGGWIIKVRMNDPADVDSLLDADQYTTFCEKENSSH